MIKVSEETRRKINGAADIVSDFSKLSGDFSETVSEGKKKSDDFFSELLKSKEQSIRDGEFKIVVCGKFKNGKSTFVNALLEKETMAAKATACTAVIAIVSKGTSEGQVTVVYNDGREKILTLEGFTNEFQLTDDEQHKIDAAAENGEEIVFDRFADVDHVEMQSMHPMFESGCSLIDTPGLEEALSRDKTTTKFLPNADAVVFMLNAISLFSKAEREFIDEHFAGKHKNNVFFVINRVNQLNEGQLESNIIPAVKHGLRSCFTDENGSFDEELFGRRVFYVNAYGALCAVTGVMEKVFAGGKWGEFPIDINTTGMPEYEASQMAFINSDEKNNAVFASALDMIANNFKGSVGQMKAKLNSMAMNDKDRKEAAKKANEALEEAEKTVQKIEDAFERFGSLASNAMFLDLISYFDREVKGEYAAHVRNTITAEHYKTSWQIMDGMLNALAILPVDAIREKARKAAEEHMQPISEDLDTYIKNKMQLWKTKSGACIKPYADDLNAELNDLCEQFDAHIEASIASFEGGNTTTTRTAKGNLQTAIAILIGKDMSAVVDINNAGGSISWGQLLSKFVSQGLIDYILLMMAPHAIFLKFGIDALIVAVKAKQAAQQRALAMGEAAIEGYMGELKKRELSFKKSIIEDIDKTAESVSEVARKRLESEKEYVEQLAGEHARSEADENAIRERLQAIIDKMKLKIEDLYEMINGRRPSQAEFDNLGVNEK